jgi:L-ascorbate metabolism protein UlaG (beta-lactamase superfamily)
MSLEAAPLTLPRSKARRWLVHLWREWIVESRRPIAPAFAKPDPGTWQHDHVTIAWLGHATVLMNFFGINIITDPALFPRVGIRVAPFFTIGPKRLTAPALVVRQLPLIDLVLLSHAHFDHFDRRTLRAISRNNARIERNVAANARVITGPRTSDLLRRTGWRHVTELSWGQSTRLLTHDGEVEVTACRVKHWGARVQRDNYRGYNAYLVERAGKRILFGGDTACTDAFNALRRYGRIDLALMSIGAYNPWIRSHATPEEAVAMATDAGARFIVPIHHQTFRLSAEPFREPIERFETALRHQPERIALREIGETFVLPET